MPPDSSSYTGASFQGQGPHSPGRAPHGMGTPCLTADPVVWRTATVLQCRARASLETPRCRLGLGVTLGSGGDCDCLRWGWREDSGGALALHHVTDPRKGPASTARSEEPGRGPEQPKGRTRISVSQVCPRAPRGVTAPQWGHPEDPLKTRHCRRPPRQLKLTLNFLFPESVL